MAESILIVDDEASVRQSCLDWLNSKMFRDWLAVKGLSCEVHAVADAEAALRFAEHGSIDLAILDWHLGAGLNGLQLLQDLADSHTDIVAILITAFAEKVTPLDALRMGVRDYLDKDKHFTRDTLLASVQKQLERIVPFKRQRENERAAREFHAAVEKILPLVQSAAAMNDRVPLPDAIRALILFLMRTTQAADGVLVAHHAPAAGPAIFRAFGSDGSPLDALPVPFERSLAASVVSMQAPCVLNMREAGLKEPVELQPFEQEHRYLLAAPIQVAAGTQVVIELFDKPDGRPFGEDDRRQVAAASDLGAELLRQSMSERQTRRTLFDAVQAALQASQSLALSPRSEAAAPPPAAVLDSLKEGLSASGNALMDADTSLQLAEGIRVLALRHGPAAVKHCLAMVEGLRKLLDEMTC